MKCGLASIASSADAHAALEAARLAAALLVERHQAVDFGRGERPAIGLAAEARDDLRARTGALPSRDVGRQREDASARLGVSEMPVALYGPAMIRSRRCGSVVMPAPPEPPPANDQSCGRIKILVRAFEPADERGRDPCCAGADQDRLGAHRHAAAAVGRRRPGRSRTSAAPRARRRSRCRCPRSGRCRPTMIAQLEHVLAVGREDVVDHDAAARAVRRALDVIPRVLRHVARDWCRCRRRGGALRSPTAMRLMSPAAFR